MAAIYGVVCLSARQPETQVRARRRRRMRRKGKEASCDGPIITGARRVCACNMYNMYKYYSVLRTQRCLTPYGASTYLGMYGHNKVRRTSARHHPMDPIIRPSGVGAERRGGEGKGEGLTRIAQIESPDASPGHIKRKALASRRGGSLLRTEQMTKEKGAGRRAERGGLQYRLDAGARCS